MGLFPERERDARDHLIDERDESGIVPPPNDWLDGLGANDGAEAHELPDDPSKSPDHFLRFLLHALRDWPHIRLCRTAVP